MQPKWDNEKELGRAVVEFLRAEGWKVYPEIYDIDIVATKEDPNSEDNLKVIGIECKKRFNLTVLRQACDKSRLVDEMYVAVSPSGNRNDSFGCMLAAKLGIGVYYVHKKDDYHCEILYRIIEKVEAENQPRKSNICRLLDPISENFAEAGQAGGKQWTLFKQTSHKLVEYVKENPGKKLREIIANIEHHYLTNSSAYSSLSRMIRNGVIKDVEFRGKFLWPKDGTN